MASTPMDSAASTRLGHLDLLCDTSMNKYRYTTISLPTKERYFIADRHDQRAGAVLWFYSWGWRHCLCPRLTAGIGVETHFEIRRVTLFTKAEFGRYAFQHVRVTPVVNAAAHVNVSLAVLLYPMETLETVLSPRLLTTALSLARAVSPVKVSAANPMSKTRGWRQHAGLPWSSTPLGGGG